MDFLCSREDGRQSQGYGSGFGHRAATSDKVRRVEILRSLKRTDRKDGKRAAEIAANSGRKGAGRLAG